MINLVLTLKLIHVLGAAVLFGTGLGIAYFMWMADRSRDPATVAHTARIVVIADGLFTATAVIAQPITGGLLAWSMGYSIWDSWIVTSLVIYVAVGLCWLPVVGIQIELRNLARAAMLQEEELTTRYRRLFRIWFALGWPAFIGVIAIFALMIWKPHFW